MYSHMASGTNAHSIGHMIGIRNFSSVQVMLNQNIPLGTNWTNLCSRSIRNSPRFIANFSLQSAPVSNRVSDSGYSVDPFSCLWSVDQLLDLSELRESCSEPSCTPREPLVYFPMRLLPYTLCTSSDWGYSFPWECFS